MQLKLKILIESPNIVHQKKEKQSECGLCDSNSNVVKRVKKLALTVSLFHILHEKYILNHVAIVQTPEVEM